MRKCNALFKQPNLIFGISTPKTYGMNLNPKIASPCDYGVRCKAKNRKIYKEEYNLIYFKEGPIKLWTSTLSLS